MRHLYNQFKFFGLVALIFFSHVTLSQAQDISFNASIDPNLVELGSSAQLTLTINGADSVPAVQLPKVDGLETRYVGPSTQVSIIDGKMSRSTALNFTVIPLKTGEFKIPAITVSINNKDYVSQPILINVVNPGTATPSPADANAPAATLKDKIFIVMGTSKKEVYLNEPVPLFIKLFINNVQVKNIQYPSFEHDGFTVDEFKEPRRGTQDLGGTNYQVLEFQTYMYPSRTGDLTLGPTKLGANIVFKSARKNGSPFNQFGSVFDDDVFENVFGAYDVKTVMLESAQLGIKVLPLPEEGKPANFPGAVGKYDFDMTVSPNQVKVGDPITVRMKVTGDGNLKAINMPAFKDSADFKFYDPKITESDGTKILEQVVIPANDHVSGLPAVNFGYFDPAEKKYTEITKGPFPLTITPLEKGEESKVVGLSSPAQVASSSVKEDLGQDIHFIKEDPGVFQNKGFVLYQSGVFIGLSVISFLIWLGLFINYKFMSRLKTDVRLARRLQAPRQAKAGLAMARIFLDKADMRNFYDSLFKTLQEYFGNKFHIPSAAVSANAIAPLMRANPRKEETLKIVSELFSECELVRYASGEADSEKMKSALRRAEEIIDLFERSY